MNGIILAGSSGTMLFPLTLGLRQSSCFQFMTAGIQDILIISTPKDLPSFEELLKDGSSFGIHLSYKVQPPSPDGLAQAFILGEEFIGDDSCCMALGDKIFYGAGLGKHLLDSVERVEKGIANLFGQYVNDLERFGAVEFDKDNNAISIEEKPKNPKSNYAVTALYFYPKGVSKLAKQVKPSARGELEITSLNNMYPEKGQVHVSLLGRGYAWLDTGTMESLLEASSFVKTVEEHQGLKICCPEEIAYKNGWITKEKLFEIGDSMKKNEYGQYLMLVSEERIIS